MMPSIDPKQMANLMKQMGIKNEQVDAERVEIFKAGGGKIVVENPQIIMIEMKGQKSFQVSGDVSEVAGEVEKGESDVDVVVNETGCAREEAEAALAETKGDLADAILRLKK